MIYGVGSWLRNVQTGYLRSYVLFLVLAAVGIFVVLSYFVRHGDGGLIALATRCRAAFAS